MLSKVVSFAVAALVLVVLAGCNNSTPSEPEAGTTPTETTPGSDLEKTTTPETN